MSLFLLALLFLPTTSLANDQEAIVPSVQYCVINDDNEENCFDRAWKYPSIRISLVCNYDFRQMDVTPNPYFFPDESSETIQATWGPFLDNVVSLVPQVGKDARRVGTTGLFWMHGGEGRPGWEIPPCGTNRTQAVVNLSYLTVILNETTTDPDLYNTGLSYSTINAYINEGSIRDAIEQYVCNDLERLYVGVEDGINPWTADDIAYFYPIPEEICPRVTNDDTVWEDYWWLFLIVAVLVIASISYCTFVNYCACAPLHTADTSKHDDLPNKTTEQAKDETTPDV